mmetsp:Transcript_21263/g.24457  ORF Transcript_21263/g.24457 Transcript_21263/m.24457 type:complete len:130 (+) Transcript_21263:84-473(+)
MQEAPASCLSYVASLLAEQSQGCTNGTDCIDPALDLVRRKLWHVKLNGREVSEDCIERTCAVLFSAMSSKKSNELCKVNCEQWFDSCRQDYFTADFLSSELSPGEITFCIKNSLICSKIEDINPDPMYF